MQSPLSGAWFAHRPWVRESFMLNALASRERALAETTVRAIKLADAISDRAEMLRDARYSFRSDPFAAVDERHGPEILRPAFREVSARGYSRAEIVEAYRQVTSLTEASFDINDLLDFSAWKPPSLVERKTAGGVIIDRQGRTLLRRPTGDYGGYVWTFPKGGIDPGERPAMAALREVFEETGWRCRIRAKIGVYKGSTSVVTFYLMSPISLDGEMDAETESVVWARPMQAVNLIQKTHIAAGRERDLRVFRDALTLYDQMNNTLLSSRVSWKMPESVEEPSPARVRVTLPDTLR